MRCLLAIVQSDFESLRKYVQLLLDGTVVDLAGKQILLNELYLATVVWGAAAGPCCMRYLVELGVDPLLRNNNAAENNHGKEYLEGLLTSDYYVNLPVKTELLRLLRLLQE